ncbi:KTI12 family protein [Wolbachia endosymbiont of Mansonella ozzardi]|uniref:KTI12 family protein n=1 Tax=Wolbachia endosymbiont of Mansonella ozzardi TaxID=137464 RepID=UPI001CE17D16|nr:KTI12 family protein [Wolbachia endosymbiont of Mansonella ozzardi]
MSKTLVYLTGFPGSGKFTVARKLSEIIDAVIVSSNLLNNVTLNVVKLPNAEVSDDLWEKFLRLEKIC